MRFRWFICLVSCLTIVGGLAATALAGDAIDKAALAKVDAYLQAKKAVISPQKTLIKDKAVLKLFPDSRFVAVRYRQYPVAVAPPAGMKSSNVMVVPRQGKVRMVNGTVVMGKMFSARLRQFKGKLGKEALSRAVRAYLTLVQEEVQDGFYKFEIIKVAADKKDDGTMSVTGRSMVTRGGNGDIHVTITVQANGNVDVARKTALRPGPRPRCQATKLLDEDPVVRYMAETELLFMGPPARGYLLEQRQKASAPLQRAIDGILRKIERQE